jgi:hypothetical protein
VRQAIAFELKLLTSELAVDLARFTYLRDWTTEDLHMMADLIVTAMLATVLELLEACPRDTETDERIIRVPRSIPPAAAPTWWETALGDITA